MFKKTMTFDDLEGNEVSQTFYFNYTKKEVMELLEFKQLEAKIAHLTTPTSESGLSEPENAKMAYDIFQELILDAYGEKGADNVTFVKNERTREYLKNHVAFVEIIFEFLENPELAAQFIENCLPAKIVAKAKAEMEKEEKGGKSVVSNDMVAASIPVPGTMAGMEKSDNIANEGVKRPSIEGLTPADIIAMPKEEFDRLDVRRLSRESMIAAFGRKNGA